MYNSYLALKGRIPKDFIILIFYYYGKTPAIQPITVDISNIKYTFKHELRMCEKKSKSFGCHGLAISSFDDIYIADSLNNRILIFSREGKFISFFGYYGNKKCQFNNPLDLAFNREENLYVTDTYNHRVQKLRKVSFNFEHLLEFGTKGHKPGEQIVDPYAIAICPKNKVYVSDQLRITIFDEHGNYITHISDGVENISGLTINNDGLIYTTNYTKNNNSVIRVYNSDYVGQLR
jgi:hypothetical protein